MNLVHIPKTGGTSMCAVLGLDSNSHLPASRVPRPRFAFVRHPLDRLVSAYEFCRSKPESYLLDAAGLSFAEFARLPDDGVFLVPQSTWLDEEVDFLGRFERLREDFARISDKPLPHLRASFRRPWREYYDADTLKMARERYAMDFERFGYVPTP